jgi:hypothetical protein
MKNFLFLWSLLVLALAGCGGGEAATSTTSSQTNDEEEAVVEEQVDEETGLPFNPEEAPDGEFVIEGVVSSLTLTPQDKPEYVVQLPSGKRYRIRSQPLSETFFDDGTPVSPSTLRQGMTVRATVEYFPDEGVAGEYRTADLTFFLAEE